MCMPTTQSNGKFAQLFEANMMYRKRSCIKFRIGLAIFPCGTADLLAQRLIDANFVCIPDGASVVVFSDIESVASCYATLDCLRIAGERPEFAAEE